MKTRCIWVMRIWLVWVLTLVFLTPSLVGIPPDFIREHYAKYEYQIPMRDGVRLFTQVYVPKDKTRTYPFILKRTPYGVKPYGLDQYVVNPGVQSSRYFEEAYIVVYQDVRGRYMSEGEFLHIRPIIEGNRGPRDIDETTDTYDTVDWLIENVPSNNGKVGISGISYPGFYASMGTIAAHPAVKATSPQAPVSTWMAGDDWYHNGAFLLAHAFAWLARNGFPRPEPTEDEGRDFEYGTPDGYEFFQDAGPLPAVNERYLKGQVHFWNQLMAHGTWDEYWAARNVLPRLKGIRPAVLVVGGWFDTENLFGALRTYEAIEKQNPGAQNMLVMGPWSHGQWNQNDGHWLGDIDFGSRTSEFYTEFVELPFFNFHLKGQGTPDLAEAVVFETGANEWRYLDSWPPDQRKPRSLYLRDGERLSFEPPGEGETGFDEYVSDPAKPVPYTGKTNHWYDESFMLEDQRFAARRPDVLSYSTAVLEEDVRVAGPLTVSFYVSTSGTDSDWVVKVIDVFPPDTANPASNPREVELGGYQMLVRGDVLRGKFRNSLATPEPFVPGEVTKIKFDLQDIFHTFKKKHQIMIQVQSTWFPMIDLNPQKLVNIYNARPEDFQKAAQRVFHSAEFPSSLEFGVVGSR
jgi:putative CocE/NonD family hydrolase